MAAAALGSVLTWTGLSLSFGLQILNLGYLEADAGFFLRGANTSTLSNPSGPSQPERRPLVMYSVLIDHPTEGESQCPAPLASSL